MPEEQFNIPYTMIEEIIDKDDLGVVTMYLKNGVRVTAAKSQFTDFKAYKENVINFVKAQKNANNSN